MARHRVEGRLGVGRPRRGDVGPRPGRSGAELGREQPVQRRGPERREPPAPIAGPSSARTSRSRTASSCGPSPPPGPAPRAARAEPRRTAAPQQALDSSPARAGAPPNHLRRRRSHGSNIPSTSDTRSSAVTAGPPERPCRCPLVRCDRRRCCPRGRSHPGRTSHDRRDPPGVDGLSEPRCTFAGFEQVFEHGPGAGVATAPPQGTRREGRPRPRPSRSDPVHAPLRARHATRRSPRRPRRTR